MFGELRAVLTTPYNELMIEVKEEIQIDQIKHDLLDRDKKTDCTLGDMGSIE